MTTAQSGVGRADYAELIGSLDLAGKVALLTGATMFTLAPAPAIGLAQVRFSDGPTGVRGLKFSGGPRAALFPNATLIASAWSEDAAYEVGRLLAEEALAQQVHVVLGPTINLHRSPLGGRLFEAYSEDPLLTGALAAAYVRGLQDSGVGACLKHLVANESETQRHTMSSVVDEATLRELYLLPFEIAAAQADPWSMMAAYNDVNGVAATEQHHVINEIVKGEWGYSGLVMSDWFATKTAGPAARGGLDLVMPGPSGPWGPALVRAVTAGEVSEAVIDDHLRRLLRLADRAGALGTPRDYPEDLPAPGSPVRREQLTRLAATGMTVLTNNGALPLRRPAAVALIGRLALQTTDMGGGSARVSPPYEVSVAQGLAARLGGAVTACDGVEVRTRPIPARDGFLADERTGAAGVRFTLVGADGSVLDERLSPSSTTLVGIDDGLAAPVAELRFRAVLSAAGPVEVGVLGLGSWQLRADGQDLAFELALSGDGFGEELLAPPAATARLRVGPSAVLEGTVTPRPAGDGAGTSAMAPAAGLFGMFALIARDAPREPGPVIAEAAAAAAAAEVAVVVVGLTEEQETEAVDKTTLRLPGAQDDLVFAVAAAARQTVVVVNAATPVLMPWLAEVDAVLWAGLPGQEGGHAVAAALLGDIEPAGRLVTTFPAGDGQAPAWNVTPANGELHYAEGTFIGHRGHYAGLAPPPVFWFGHGLGYSTWEYSAARLLPSGPAVAVSVTNTGERPSREVAQLYFQPEEAGQPVRLVGWRAATVEPGATADLEIPLDPRLLRRWDPGAGGWTRLTGRGRLLVARGLGDIRATIDAG
ncbi:MAG TPA: glycoside hydrolase family 3 C-terminal domain-containing protein [Streptosporangiaceae bacterium]|nr:glycoside hydrolase family 3 C-terminal domain-containing protein [Streptosporangiaceae bacterium]